MRRGRGGPLFAAPLLLAAACAPQSTRPADVRYVVGEPYALGGVWSYPSEDYGLAEAGLATVLPDERRGRRTANGEVHDPGALVAAHRTVQLPAVLSVWNLATGHEVRVRVNDRGPEAPGRVLALSRRAAALLGFAPGEPAPVRIVVDPEASRAVVEGLFGAEGPRVSVATAPMAVVEQEQLAPIPGARAAAAAGPDPGMPVSVAAAAVPAGPARRPPAPLPEVVNQRGIVPIRLMVDGGVFFRRDLAERRAATLGRAHVEAVGSGRQPQFRVRSGPFATAVEADRALDAALQRGIPDAKIVLE